LKALSDSNYDSDLATSSESDLDLSDYEYDPDDKIFDEDKDDDIPPFSYDVDNPCIDKGRIIPSIIVALNEQSKVIKDHEVLRFGDGTTDVTVSTNRHSINLEQMTCSCQSWQVTRKPCSHALAFIETRTKDIDLDDYAHEYCSMEMFRKAYADVFKSMTSKQLWPRVDIGYTIKKSKLRRKPDKPRVSRIKAYEEPGNKKKRECSECHELGHMAKYCQGGPTASQKKMRVSSNAPNVTESTSK
jgi:hypothetical protein